MTISKSTASGFLNGRFTRFFVDTSGSNTGVPSWTIVGGELTGKWTIDPQLEDYTTKDADAIVYYPTRYKWNGSFDTNYLDDDTGQEMCRDVILSVGQSAPIGKAPGPVVRVGWRIQEDIQGVTPSTQAHMVGLVALKVDYQMDDAKMGKMTITFTGSGAIDLATDPGT
jgi:hypothetical protein